MEQILTITCLCINHLNIHIIKLTINTTKNRVETLIVEGANASEIIEMTPALLLTPVLLSSDHVARVYQAVEYYSANSSFQMLFENYLQDIDCTEVEAQRVVSSLEQERSLTGRLTYALQVIRSVNFDWDKCLQGCWKIISRRNI